MLFVKGWDAELCEHDYVFKNKDVHSFEIDVFDHNGSSVYYVHGTNICLKCEDELDAFVEMSNKLYRNRD